ncbi:MAG: molybdenum cofactor biosynthesis protein MoaE [Verrucomicrobiales bacterium]|nr:molybdenum cofactor biosynthesis protein MoaE [Verrucomicrobiales bacterium]
MRVEVQLTAEPIVPCRLIEPDHAGRAGACVEFTGVVRGEEKEQRIAALEYEAYPDMARRVMQALLARLGQRHRCLSARVIHRVGIIPVGEAAIWLGITASHRREAFALLAEFMDQLKQEVPIWKTRSIPFEAQRPHQS